MQLSDNPSPFVEKRRTIVEGIFSKFETEVKQFSYTKEEMEKEGVWEWGKSNMTLGK